MREDWTHHDLEAERHQKKARSTLVAAQSIGPSAQAVAYVQAEIHLLEALHSVREMLACVRDKQKHKGSF